MGLTLVDPIERRRITCWGAVQGVGFRPFAYVLAQELGLTGYVINSAQGAAIEVQGTALRLDEYEYRLLKDLPKPGQVEGKESTQIPVRDERGFSIQSSTGEGSKSALVLPDLAPCLQCLAEIHNPKDRRYRYPFTNCTHCGPRFSIIRGLPYDRPNTSMARFPLCPKCQMEYDDPTDRRFHAQPTACPVCGPHLELWNSNGITLTSHDDALAHAAEVLQRGEILAVKGIGGFHLMVDARSDEAVQRLRARKHRDAKPLAVMVRSLFEAHEFADITAEELAILTSSAAPIIILRSKDRLADAVAPGNPNVGLMLPSSPLHALLMERISFPVVATSGNLSDEPICTDEHEAVSRLGGIADKFLVHNRPIVRPIDDSVCRHLGEGITVLRRARGYAPLSFPMQESEPGLVAFGAQFKGSVAVSGEKKIVVGQHVGDLDNALARDRLEEEVRDLCALQECEVQTVVHDLHPDYASTRLAVDFPGESNVHPLTRIAVQHHVAHAAALMQERAVELPFLAVVWDGTGLGPDGSIWGGEFLNVDVTGVTRTGHLRPFMLPGGDAAARHGFKSALAVLYAAFGEEGFAMAPGFTDQDDAVKRLLRSGSHCVPTTSAGRLFDAAAALGAGILYSRFEGDAAMRWEALAAEDVQYGPALPVTVVDHKFVLDWAPLLPDLLHHTGDPRIVSKRFHHALAVGIAEIAKRTGLHRVGLTGGCFQNRLLSRLTCEELRSRGMVPIEHREIPPNDGGIAFGQAVAAIRGLKFTAPY